LTPAARIVVLAGLGPAIHGRRRQGGEIGAVSTGFGFNRTSPDQWKRRRKNAAAGAAWIAGPSPAKTLKYRMNFQ
jgi:hypothetical protein